MKLYIPSIGDELVLTQHWNFNLWNEYRNRSLMDLLEDKRAEAYGPFDKNWSSITASIPKGQILKVDRIYIRKGKDEFDSVTFMWKGMATNPGVKKRTASHIDCGRVISTVEYEEKIPRKPVRFWAKLEDVNQIEFELV